MTLGPGKLAPTHKFIIRRYKPEIKRFNSGELNWQSRELSPLKKTIRMLLRKQQMGRCIYCRRKILIERRNATEDIEHFLDKSRDYYRRWAFSPVNLAIACHPCNLQKSIRNMGDARVISAQWLTSSSGQFTWLHPYFDDYHENIEIRPGWIYLIKNGAPRSAQARKMIKDCMLDSIQNIEGGRTIFLARLTRLQKLAFSCIRSNPSRAEKLLKAAELMTTHGWMDL